MRRSTSFWEHSDFSEKLTLASNGLARGACESNVEDNTASVRSAIKQSSVPTSIRWLIAASMLQKHCALSVRYLTSVVMTNWPVKPQFSVSLANWVSVGVTKKYRSEKPARCA